MENKYYITKSKIGGDHYYEIENTGKEVLMYVVKDAQDHSRAVEAYVNRTSVKSAEASMLGFTEIDPHYIPQHIVDRISDLKDTLRKGIGGFYMEKTDVGYNYYHPFDNDGPKNIYYQLTYNGKPSHTENPVFEVFAKYPEVPFNYYRMCLDPESLPLGVMIRLNYEIKKYGNKGILDK